MRKSEKGKKGKEKSQNKRILVAMVFFTSSVSKWIQDYTIRVITDKFLPFNKKKKTKQNVSLPLKFKPHYRLLIGLSAHIDHIFCT